MFLLDAVLHAGEGEGHWAGSTGHIQVPLHHYAWGEAGQQTTQTGGLWRQADQDLSLPLLVPRQTSPLRVSVFSPITRRVDEDQIRISIYSVWPSAWHMVSISDTYSCRA